MRSDVVRHPATRPARIRAAVRRWLDARGQSLVEFALILPLLLLLALIAVDFGRIYLGYINLQNMARIAANFAANNPNAWIPGGEDFATIDKYENQILADAAATNCALNPATPPSPTFTDVDGDGDVRGLGDRASVALTCRFSVITPIVASIVGGTVNVSASSVFPVKSALSETSSGGGGGPGGCQEPVPAINADPSNGAAPLDVNFADGSAGGAGVSWLWDFGDGTTSTLRDPGHKVYADPGTYVVTLQVTNTCGTFITNPGVTITVTPTATPELCTVPSLDGVRFNDAQARWGQPAGAGFTSTVQRGPGAPNGNFVILSQSIVASTGVPCDSQIFVNNP